MSSLLTDLSLESRDGAGSVNEPALRLERILDKLKERSFRITPQRLAILRILAASQAHPSVDVVFQKVKKSFPTTSLATVYKTVSLLKELGEILELRFPDGKNRYDGNKPFPHPHLICVRCKKIIDPDLNGLEELNKEVSTKTGFRIVGQRVDFYGVCPKCAKKGG